LFQLFATGVVDTSGAPSLEMFLMLFSVAWGKKIHEKKPEAKNLVTLFQLFATDVVATGGKFSSSTISFMLSLICCTLGAGGEPAGGGAGRLL
jgi:hypothetical protein